MAEMIVKYLQKEVDGMDRMRNRENEQMIGGMG